MFPSILAGMPAPLPTNLTEENLPHLDALAPILDVRLQGLSFFLVLFFLCAWAFQSVWNWSRTDSSRLSKLTFRQALVLIIGWGMASLVVLTMISGARELMTPGAWQQQGWTYKLADESSPFLDDSKPARREAVERLRFQLFQYATRNEGKFPEKLSDIENETLWSIPQHSGFQFVLVEGKHGNDSNAILVFEPEIETERFVIMTNGMIGSMRSAELEKALTNDK